MNELNLYPIKDLIEEIRNREGICFVMAYVDIKNLLKRVDQDESWHICIKGPTPIREALILVLQRFIRDMDSCENKNMYEAPSGEVDENE